MNSTMLRNAVHICAIFAFYLATMMVIPGLVDLYLSNADWKVFAASSAGIGGAAALMAVATRGGPPVVSTRFTFLLVNMLWLGIVIYTWVGPGVFRKSLDREIGKVQLERDF